MVQSFLVCAEQPVHTRQCPDISVAYLYATTPHMFSPEDHTEQAFNNVRDAVRMPLYGCDCYAYGLLAAGCVDLVVEADLKPYDYMALVPIVQEAGGVMTDWLVRLDWSASHEACDTPQPWYDQNVKDVVVWSTATLLLSVGCVASVTKILC